MKSWEDYKEYVKNVDNQSYEDIKEIENIVKRGEQSNMNYEKINKFDSANGPGIRTSLFVCGCPIHCPGCCNKELQDFKHGKLFDSEAIDKILEYLSHPHVRGFTLLGGEPLASDNRMSCYTLLKQIREKYPNKDIWCYTGFRLDAELKLSLENPKTKDFMINMLSLIDVLVDGPFMEDQKDLMLQFRGSRNQRLLKAPFFE